MQKKTDLAKTRKVDIMLGRVAPELSSNNNNRNPCLVSFQAVAGIHVMERG